MLAFDIREWGFFAGIRCCFRVIYLCARVPVRSHPEKAFAVSAIIPWRFHEAMFAYIYVCMRERLNAKPCVNFSAFSRKLKTFLAKCGIGRNAINLSSQFFGIFPAPSDC